MSERGTPYEGQRPPSGHRSGERRVALVIGNSAYAHAEALRNPVNDAEAMAAVLSRLGFDVVKGIDVDLRGIGDLQAVFEDKLRGQPDVALLFYAGHGLQVAGRNYLVPVDAEITQRAHLASRALLFNDLLDDMAAQAQASLIFLDACRDNPFTRNLTRALGDTARYAGVRGGLARVDVETVTGSFIAYATAPDTLAYDGTGENSPFTAALLEHIETPGLSVGDLMIDVRNKVLAETNERQEPWDQSSLRARFYFVPEVEETPPQASEVSGAAQEWAAIQNTDSLAVLAAFQERYPDPPWSTYAEARAEELRAADEARRAEEQREREEAERERQEAEERQQREAEARARREEEAKRPEPPPSTEKAPTGEQGTTGTGLGPGGKPPGWVWTAGAGAIALVIAVWVFYPPDPTPETGSDTKSSEIERYVEAIHEAADEVLGAEVKLASGETKRIVPGSGESFKDCAECPEMVVLPSGSFMMGSPASEEGRDDDEGPQHEVRIPEPFAVGKFEITNAQYVAFLNDVNRRGTEEEPWFETKDEDSRSQITGSVGACAVEAGKEDFPVGNVSWFGARAYAKWLSEKTGKSYRLLSAAEWEYAARAGTQTRYWFGDDDSDLGEHAWYRENSGKTYPVGEKPANPWGLHDVHGNVWERVEDCWNASYADKSDSLKVMGGAWTTGNCNIRVLRGGSWYDSPRNLRSANRYGYNRVGRSADFGFRLARTLNP